MTLCGVKVYLFNWRKVINSPGVVHHRFFNYNALTFNAFPYHECRYCYH